MRMFRVAQNLVHRNNEHIVCGDNCLIIIIYGNRILKILKKDKQIYP